MLVALDDAQWLDASSAEVLTFMLRRLEGEPVAVLATVRGRPVEVPLELDRTFGAFRRLAIEPLSVGAIHRLLWGRLGINLPRPVLVRVHEITGGNPFFALELGRAIAEGSIRADGADVELPESLRAVVTERLRALPARVRETLVAVAALAAPSVTCSRRWRHAAVDDIELAAAAGRGRVRRRPDPLHASAPRARLLRGDAAAPKASASPPPRGTRCRSRGARPPSRDRGHRPRRRDRSGARRGGHPCPCARRRAGGGRPRRARGRADAPDARSRASTDAASPPPSTAGTRAT